MKKNVLLTVLFGIMLNGVLFSQLEIQNGSFEQPAEDVKYRADGEGDATVFNGNVPGWWADPNATDCGRQNTAKPAYEGTYTGYGYNNDGGSIWALAGTVEEGILGLNLSFYAWESWPADQTGVTIAALFAVYEGTDTAEFTVLDTLTKSFDPEATDADGWGHFEFSMNLPESAVGKNLLIGYDLITESADDSWFSFDNFTLSVSQPTGINYSTLETVKVFPNPTSDYLTVQLENTVLSQYTFYNVAGHEVLSGEITNQSITIDVSKLSKGVYFLKVENSLGSKVIKTILE